MNLAAILFLILGIVPMTMIIAMVISAVRGYNRGNTKLQIIAFRLSIVIMVLMGASLLTGNFAGLIGLALGYGCMRLSQKDIHPKRLKHSEGGRMVERIGEIGNEAIRE
ncbi:MAG: hypothetical protein R3B47_00330 [Bacteroidia bacterium]